MNKDIVLAMCKAHGVPTPETEVRFAPPRRWRWDFAWPKYMLALEVDGGAWVGGRHTRGKGFIADMEKQNTGMLLGWRLLRCTPQQIEDGSIFPTILRVIDMIQHGP